MQVEVGRQMEERGRADVISASLANRSGAVLTRDLDEAVELANLYAPEHLCLAVRDPWRLAEQVYAAGGIFIGEHSFEVLGDYVAGPSHVMPTGGSARFASPLNVLDFVHIISLVALDPATTQPIAPAAAAIAMAEGLDAHASAAQVRVARDSGRDALMKTAARFDDFPAYTPIEPFEVLSARLGLPAEKYHQAGRQREPLRPLAAGPPGAGRPGLPAHLPRPGKPGPARRPGGASPGCRSRTCWPGPAR